MASSLEPASTTARVAQFRACIEADRADLCILRQLALRGIPDTNGLRATVWKLLLGHLPLDQNTRASAVDKKIAEYDRFCHDLIVDPSHLAMEEDDHPLSTSDNSKWSEHFKDTALLEQIERDVTRTHPDMHFFSGSDASASRHREEMKRALFLFAKLNSGLTYVQGMNELLAPLYYLFSTQNHPEENPHAEAESFFCFVDLMGEFRDHFCKQLDNSSIGIRATLTTLSALLKAHDEELWEHLEVRLKVNAQFYAFRWITLALTQEFPFPDALHLWDAILSHPFGHRTEGLLHLCLAMLIHAREELLQKDFAGCLKLLQNYPPTDVSLLIEKGLLLSKKKSIIVLDD